MFIARIFLISFLLVVTLPFLSLAASHDSSAARPNIVVIMRVLPVDACSAESMVSVGNRTSAGRVKLMLLVEGAQPLLLPPNPVETIKAIRPIEVNSQ